ncbi:MAG TPA: hypothetical protein VHA07_10015 [Devosia sp.]|nr:hypothetical protein [Devosia sp.]
MPGNKIAPIVPDSFEGAYRLANVIAASGMAPKAFVDRNGNAKTEMICVAMMHGMEVGMTPMAALQSIAVINGMPTIWGDGMLGLVQASGLLEEIDEYVETDKDGIPIIATCKVKRLGRKQWTIQAFTKAEAQRAGLWGKTGPWTQYPRRMMQMRARSWALRDAFADVLRGLQCAEEIRDMVHIGSGSTIPPEPTRAQFRDANHDDHSDFDPTDSAGDNGTPSTAEAPGEADNPPPSSPGAAEPPSPDAPADAAEPWTETECKDAAKFMVQQIGKLRTPKAIDNYLATSTANLAEIRRASEKTHAFIVEHAEARKQQLVAATP